MSWLSIAANLLRDAMGSSTEPAEPVPDVPPSADISGVMEVLNRHRAEIEKNFEAVAGILNAQSERHLKAMQIQRRWNYGLAAALVIVAIFVIATYGRS